MKLSGLAVFGVGYVLGTRAGRERYAEIVAAAKLASKRLADYSRRREPADHWDESPAFGYRANHSSVR